MTGEELLNVTRQSGIMPVFSHSDSTIVMDVLEVCQKAGVHAFEFTNRGDDARSVFREVRKYTEHHEDLYLGAGTVLNPDDANFFITEGADFIVSPILDLKIAEICSSAKISWTPGCMTLTEILQGHHAGASLTKIFPGNILGPEFVKAIKAPCPFLNIMPTGGVTIERENLKKWFEAGVHCVGLGSGVFNQNTISQKGLDELDVTLKEVVSEVRNLCH